MSNKKKLIRQLQAARGCAYMTAMNELNKLPEGTDWRAYIARVEQLPDSLRLQPKKVHGPAKPDV